MIIIPTKFFNSLKDLRKYVENILKKGYNGIHIAKNVGGKTKYYVKTLGKPKKGRITKVTDLLKRK